MYFVKIYKKIVCQCICVHFGGQTNCCTTMKLSDVRYVGHNSVSHLDFFLFCLLFFFFFLTNRNCERKNGESD